MPAVSKRRRRNQEDDPQPIFEWTDKTTGRSYTTVTVRQDDGRFLCVLADEPLIRETGRTAREATTAMLKRLHNPDTTPEEDADDIRVVGERMRHPKWISREDFLRSFGREDLIRKRGR